MANISETGLRPYANVASTATQTGRRRIASNNGTAIFRFDCMKVTAAGVWGLATAGGGVSGVACGAEYFDTTINGRRSNPFLPAATTYTGTTFDDHGDNDQSFVFVTLDPLNDRFVGQLSASTPALTDVTKNVNIVASAGSTVNGMSGHTLDQTTIATTLNQDFRIQDWLRKVTNDPATTNFKYIVQIDLGLMPPFSSTNPGTVGV